MNGSATWLGSGYPRGYLLFLQSLILFLDLFGFSVCCFALELLFLISTVYATTVWLSNCEWKRSKMGVQLAWNNEDGRK